MPQTEIVADRFHVMKQVNEELDSERKQTKKAAERQKNKTEKEKLLTGLKKSKYVLLRNEKDFKEEGKRKLEAIR